MFFSIVTFLFVAIVAADECVIVERTISQLGFFSAVNFIKPGSKYFFPAGEYDISAELGIRTEAPDDCPAELTGEPGTVFYTKTSANGRGFKIDRASNIIFNDITFRGGSNGVEVTNSKRITFNNCNITQVSLVGLVVKSYSKEVTFNGGAITRTGSGSEWYNGFGAVIGSSWSTWYNENYPDVTANIVLKNVLFQDIPSGCLYINEGVKEGTIYNVTCYGQDRNALSTINFGFYSSAANLLFDNNVILGTDKLKYGILQKNNLSRGTGNTFSRNMIVLPSDGTPIYSYTNENIVCESNKSNLKVSNLPLTPGC